MTLQIRQRLFFNQTRNALLVALVLGVLISFGQIIYDFNSEQKRIDATVVQVLNTAKESASQAAYSLNNELAGRVVKGLFEYQPIYFAQIVDDFGRQLAFLERAPIHHRMPWLAGWIYSDQDSYSVPLWVTPEDPVGEMRIRVDRILVAQNFLERSGLVILTGILRNFILAIFFGFLFYFTLGRPVSQTIAGLSGVDPDQPGKTHLSVPKGHEKDELGLLVNKLNQILMEFDETLQKRDRAEEQLKQKQRTIFQLNQQLEERVRQRTSELEGANQEMEAFTYSVSHDLRAPLRTISGFSDILLDEYGEQLDEQAHHYLERVRQGTQKMERLINDLLKLARVTRGDLHHSDVDLSAMANEILVEMGHGDPAREVKVNLPDRLCVHADKRFIRVVLENLLSNAWKYTEKEDQPEISMGCEKKGEQTVYFIKDNGAGFDMKYAHKLFTPFQRLHSSQQFDGTGVGLATVHRVIHRHGGEVWAQGEVGKGAIFYFTLPRAPAPTGIEFV